MNKWPFTVKAVGEDIVCENILITCFGGWGGGNIADPQDNGETASGVNTKFHAVDGVSVAMDGRQFSKLRPAEHRALDCAPIPRILNKFGLTAWHTVVIVTIGNTVYAPRDGIVDLGPGLQATPVVKEMPDTKQAHALDLTPIAAMHFQPNVSLRLLARTFEVRGGFRIIGAAKFLTES